MSTICRNAGFHFPVVLMSRHVVASVGEVPPGTSKLVTAKGREIGLFNVGGKFYALGNRCPHKGGRSAAAASPG